MVTFRWSLRFLGATKEGKEDNNSEVKDNSSEVKEDNNMEVKDNSSEDKVDSLGVKDKEDSLEDSSQIRMEVKMEAISLSEVNNSQTNLEVKAINGEMHQTTWEEINKEVKA